MCFHCSPMGGNTPKQQERVLCLECPGWVASLKYKPMTSLPTTIYLEYVSHLHFNRHFYVFSLLVLINNAF